MAPFSRRRSCSTLLTIATYVFVFFLGSTKRRDSRRFPNPKLDRYDRYRRVPRAKHALDTTTGRLSEWGTTEEWNSGVNLTWEQAGWGPQGEPLTLEEAEAQRKADYAAWLEVALKSIEEGKEARRKREESGLWPWEGEWGEVSRWPDADVWGPAEPGAWGHAPTAPAAPVADAATTSTQQVSTTAKTCDCCEMRTHYPWLVVIQPPAVMKKKNEFSVAPKVQRPSHRLAENAWSIWYGADRVKVKTYLIESLGSLCGCLLLCSAAFSPLGSQSGDLSSFLDRGDSAFGASRDWQQPAARVENTGVGLSPARNKSEDLCAVNKISAMMGRGTTRRAGHQTDFITDFAWCTHHAKWVVHSPRKIGGALTTFPPILFAALALVHLRLWKFVETFICSLGSTPQIPRVWANAESMSSRNDSPNALTKVEGKRGRVCMTAPNVVNVVEVPDAVSGCFRCVTMRRERDKRTSTLIIFGCSAKSGQHFPFSFRPLRPSVRFRPQWESPSLPWCNLPTQPPSADTGGGALLRRTIIDLQLIYDRSNRLVRNEKKRVRMAALRAEQKLEPPTMQAARLAAKQEAASTYRAKRLGTGNFWRRPNTIHQRRVPLLLTMSTASCEINPFVPDDPLLQAVHQQESIDDEGTRARIRAERLREELLLLEEDKCRALAWRGSGQTNLARGERYTNADFTFASAIANSGTHPELIMSYDICCQRKHNCGGRA
ncbi:hypothetical protein DFH06DRAFT_1125907 [Mycena polygramma]|nr:hypothetical protein DFH06DRAFT_1125907 [Mycena polygramma]